MCSQTYRSRWICRERLNPLRAYGVESQQAIVESECTPRYSGVPPAFASASRAAIRLFRALRVLVDTTTVFDALLLPPVPGVEAGDEFGRSHSPGLLVAVAGTSSMYSCSGVVSVEDCPSGNDARVDRAA